MNICFIDTETSASKPVNGRIIEIAYDICTPWPELKVLTSVDQKIQLSDHDFRRAEPKAMSVNRFTHEEWAEAPRASAGLWRELTMPLVNVTLCGQNVGFDRDWILSEMERYDLLDKTAEEPPWGRRFVDIQSYSHALAEEFELPDFGLHTVYDALGAPELPRHRAGPDVQRAKAVYRAGRALMRASVAYANTEHDLGVGIDPYVALCATVRCAAGCGAPIGLYWGLTNVDDEKSGDPIESVVCESCTPEAPH